jgi:hypothetical protein
LHSSAFDPWPMHRCTACSNHDVASCRVAALHSQLAQDADGCGDGAEAWQIAVSVVATCVGTAALLAAAAWLWSRRSRGHASGVAGCVPLSRPPKSAVALSSLGPVGSHEPDMADTAAHDPKI